MPFNIELVGQQIAAAMLASLKTDSARVVALAKAEGHKLAFAFSGIAGMLARQEIDSGEAEILARVQKNASEAVIASLAEVSRVAAGRAMAQGLASVIGIVDRAAGVPIVAALLQVAIGRR